MQSSSWKLVVASWGAKKRFLFHSRGSHSIQSTESFYIRTYAKKMERCEISLFDGRFGLVLWLNDRCYRVPAILTISLKMKTFLIYIFHFPVMKRLWFTVDSIVDAAVACPFMVLSRIWYCHGTATIWILLYWVVLCCVVLMLGEQSKCLIATSHM